MKRILNLVAITALLLTGACASSNNVPATADLAAAMNQRQEAAVNPSTPSTPTLESTPATLETPAPIMEPSDSDVKVVNVTTLTTMTEEVSDLVLESETVEMGEPVEVTSLDDIDTLPALEGASDGQKKAVKETVAQALQPTPEGPVATVPHIAGPDAWRSTEKAPQTAGALSAEFASDTKLCQDWLELHPEFQSCIALIERAKGFEKRAAPTDYPANVSGVRRHHFVTLTKGDELWVEHRVDPSGREFEKVIGRVSCTNAIEGTDGEIYLSDRGRLMVLPVTVTRNFTVTKTVREETKTTVTKVRRPRVRFEALLGPSLLSSDNPGSLVHGRMAVSIRRPEAGHAAYVDVSFDLGYVPPDVQYYISMDGGRYTTSAPSAQWPIEPGDHTFEGRITGTGPSGQPMELSFRHVAHVPDFDSVENVFLDAEDGEESSDGDVGINLEGRMYVELGKLDREKTMTTRLFVGLGGYLSEDPEFEGKLGLNLEGERLGGHLAVLKNSRQEEGGEAAIRVLLGATKRWSVEAAHTVYSGEDDFSSSRSTVRLGFSW